MSARQGPGQMISQARECVTPMSRTRICGQLSVLHLIGQPPRDDVAGYGFFVPRWLLFVILLMRILSRLDRELPLLAHDPPLRQFLSRVNPFSSGGRAVSGVPAIPTGVWPGPP